jgi:hypothetical protein
MIRKLKDGSEVPELTQSVTLTVKTRCPEKWLLVDKETGEVYTPYTTVGPLQWKKTEDSWMPTKQD